MEFFRHCPGCGRRFHIVLEGKKLSHFETEQVPVPMEIHSYLVPGGGRSGLVVRRVPIDAERGEPAIVDVEKFQYTYKCKFCGHEWSEKRTEKHLDPRSE